MTQRTLLTRLLSPAGFGLVLLFFLLPFVAISCDTSAGAVEATFTGTDMLIGGDPHITGPEELTGAEERDVVALFGGDIDTEPWAIMAALAIIVGMTFGLVRGRLARHAGGAGLAGLAIALLIAAELHSIGRLEDLRSSSIRGALDAPPEGTTSPRYGFWLAMTTLALLCVGQGVALARAWRHRSVDGERLHGEESDDVARPADGHLLDLIDDPPPRPDLAG